MVSKEKNIFREKKCCVLFCGLSNWLINSIYDIIIIIIWLSSYNPHRLCVSIIRTETLYDTDDVSWCTQYHALLCIFFRHGICNPKRTFEGCLEILENRYLCKNIFKLPKMCGNLRINLWKRGTLCGLIMINRTNQLISFFRYLSAFLRHAFSPFGVISFLFLIFSRNLYASIN